jgi:hypothetical protein
MHICDQINKSEVPFITDFKLKDKIFLLMHICDQINKSEVQQL